VIVTFVSSESGSSITISKLPLPSSGMVISGIVPPLTSGASLTGVTTISNVAETVAFEGSFAVTVTVTSPSPSSGVPLNVLLSASNESQSDFDLFLVLVYEEVYVRSSPSTSVKAAASNV